MKKIIPGEDIKFEEINRLGDKKIGSRARMKVQNLETKRKILKNA